MGKRKETHKFKNPLEIMAADRVKVFLSIFQPYFLGLSWTERLDAWGMVMVEFSKFVPVEQLPRCLNRVKAYMLSKKLERQDLERFEGGDKRDEDNVEGS